MGRWAQSRKRGAGSPLPSACPAIGQALITRCEIDIDEVAVVSEQGDPAPAGYVLVLAQAPTADGPWNDIDFKVVDGTPLNTTAALSEGAFFRAQVREGVDPPGCQGEFSVVAEAS